MTKFDAEKLIKDLSEEQKQRLIEKLTGEPEKKKEESFSAVTHSHVMRNSPVTTDIKKAKQEGRVTGVPVNEMPRFNKFTDDGSEHKDKQHETPDIGLTERSREPFKSIKQTCTRCSKTIETNPQFYREFYICDSCLKR